MDGGGGGGEPGWVQVEWALITVSPPARKNRSGFAHGVIGASPGSWDVRRRLTRRCPSSSPLSGWRIVWIRGSGAGPSRFWRRSAIVGLVSGSGDDFGEGSGSEIVVTMRWRSGSEIMVSMESLLGRRGSAGGICATAPAGKTK